MSTGILNTFGIENFYNTAAANDFARQNLFRVILLGGVRFTTDDLLYLTTTTLPAKAINNVEVPFMGLRFNVPGTVNYPGSNAWNVNFRIPQNLSTRRKFEDWQSSVFDDSSSTGSYAIPSKDASNQATIVLIDKQGNPLRTYNLFGVWPQQVGELALDTTTAGEIITQQVTLAYQYWRLAR
jgi:hypothetical protein